MKNYILIILLIVCFSFRADAADDPTFIQQINTLWKAKNYNQILQLATTEAAKQPPPPEAYAVLFGYHLFITANHEQAVQSLNSLLARLENTNSDGFQAVKDFKNSFLQVPSNQMQPPTSAELDSLHQILPDVFPVKSLLLSISKPD